MPLVSTRLPALNDGDRVWFAMLDGGRPVDCFVDVDILARLNRGQRDDPVAQFAVYRRVFEVIVNDLYAKGQALVVEAESVTRWEL